MDGILSLGEILDMASKLEIFLTEEEGSRIFSTMDVDSDEKVVDLQDKSSSSLSFEKFVIYDMEQFTFCINSCDIGVNILI